MSLEVERFRPGTGAEPLQNFMDLMNVEQTGGGVDGLAKHHLVRIPSGDHRLSHQVFISQAWSLGIVHQAKASNCHPITQWKRARARWPSSRHHKEA